MKTIASIFLSLVLWPAAHTNAQQSQNYLGITTSFGGGYNSFDTGLRTQENDVIEVSSGGGVSIGMTGAYAFQKHWLAGGEINYQFTQLSPPVDNADGGFRHMNIMANIQRLLPIGRGNNAFLISGGPVLSSANTFDFDASKIPGGAHNTYRYKAAVGGQVSAEFMLKKGLDGFAFLFGLRSNFIRYKLDRVTSNGVEFDAADNALDFLTTDITRPNGSGMDVTVRGIYTF